MPGAHSALPGHIIHSRLAAGPRQLRALIAELENRLIGTNVPRSATPLSFYLPAFFKVISP
jgi:hypothetical protein